MARFTGEKNAIRIVVLLAKVGPYDFAQLSALSREPGHSVCALEYDPEVKTVIYDRVRGGPFERIALKRESAGFFGFKKELFDALDRIRPDRIVLPGWYQPAVLLTYRWGAKHGVPLIVRSPSVSWDFQRSSWKEWLKRAILKNADAAIVGGAPQGRYLADLGMAKELIFDSCDVVDNEFFSRGAARARAQETVLRRKLSLPRRYFLYCGRFGPEKNLERLISAFAHYRSAAGAAPWGLVLVGDGDSGKRLAALADELGVGKAVVFTGRKSHQQLPAYYGLASVFVLPSLREPWGLVINEAEASGLPVLVSKACGGAEDLVREGVNGHTFDPTDIPALAERMRSMAASRLLKKMGKNSVRIVGEWGPERYASGIRNAAARGARKKKPCWAGYLTLSLAFPRFYGIV